MNNRKPIETIYNGYRFRSRLEARWAVFFDKLKIKYEYENEGYELPSGKRYLPDFYLPTMDVFVEVKQDESEFINNLRKLEEFYLDCGNNLVLICGTPTRETMYLLNRCTTIDFESFCMGSGLDEADNQSVELFMEFVRHNGSVFFGPVPLSLQFTLLYNRDSGYADAVNSGVNQALLAAKQARFEYNESG
jgi:hypothetical protein